MMSVALTMLGGLLNFVKHGYMREYEWLVTKRIANWCSSLKYSVKLCCDLLSNTYILQTTCINFCSYFVDVNMNHTMHKLKYRFKNVVLFKTFINIRV